MTTQAARAATGGARRGPPGATARGRGGERRMVEREQPRSYYGRPVVKPPVWTWEIPVYFFTGGTGGAAAVLAYGAERSGNRALARSAWVVAFCGISISPGLLISDLGRPERFLNMLRVFKVTSPMSVGSWMLAANGAAVAPAAAYGVLGRLGRLGRAAQVCSGLLGAPLATYTAVLLSNTSLPAWSDARWHLPLAFGASGAASAGAASAALTEGPAAAPARRLAVGGALVEAAVTTLMERHLGEVAEPYRRGIAGRLAKASKALTLGGAALLAVSGRALGGRPRRHAGRRRRAGPRLPERPRLRGRSRRRDRARLRDGGDRAKAATVAGAALVMAGSLSLRWAVYRAGFQSAQDPKYTLGPQRRRLAAH